MPELLSSSSSESSGRTTGRSDEQDSFVITETGDKDHDPGALSHQIKVSDLVEKILQGKIDLESCGECNQLIMAELQKRIGQVEEDTNHYKTAIEAFGQDFQDEEDPETVELELEKLKEEEKALRGKLQRTETEHLSTQREIAKVKADVEHLKEHAPQSPG